MKQYHNMYVNEILYSILSSAGLAENKFIKVEKNKDTNNVAVFMSGCPASCKSTIIDNQLLLSGKVFSVDSIIKEYKRLLNDRYKNAKTLKERNWYIEKYKGYVPVDFNKSQETEEVNFWYDFVTKELGGFIYDANGNVVCDSVTKDPLHEGLNRAEQRIFFKVNTIRERMPNIIHDITGTDAKQLAKSVFLAKDMGYHVVLVCAVIGLEEAIRRDDNREDRHEGRNNIVKAYQVIYQQIPKSLRTGELKALDEAWIVFTEGFHQEYKPSKAYNGEHQDIIKNPDWSDNTAFKLIKHPNGTFSLPDEEIVKRYKETTSYDFYDQKIK